MYVKDLAQSQGADLCNEETAAETIEAMLDNLPDDDAKEEIVSRRNEQSIMPEDSMFREGSVSIAEVIPVIKEALLCKDGLVEPDKQELFRE